MVGKLSRVDLREVWRHEALDFTPWLRDNIDVLNEVLDVALSSPDREQALGDFSADLVAEDETGGTVVIENQLDRSDHDHLGKLITYAVAVDARTAIWIVADPRPEHVAAVTWLNESSSVGFYLLKVEAVRIGESPAAPLLTLIVGPSLESRQAGETKKQAAERYGLRRRFWESLLERARIRTNLHRGISPGQYGHLGTGAGKMGLGLNYVVRGHTAAAELYIDPPIREGEAPKAIFEALISHKDEIEGRFGGPLNWERLDGKRASRIEKEINSGGYRDEERWPVVQDEMIDAMIRLERALRPHIDRIRV